MGFAICPVCQKTWARVGDACESCTNALAQEEAQQPAATATINLLNHFTDELIEWPLVDMTARRFEDGKEAHKMLKDVEIVRWGEGNLRWEVQTCAEETNQVDLLAADIRTNAGETVVATFYSHDNAVMLDTETYCQYLDWLNVHLYCTVQQYHETLREEDIPF